MRLMARETETEGRFGPRRSPAETAAIEHAYGGMVLERLAKHICKIAAVEWSCLFVVDRTDPRQTIVAAGCGVPWELIGARVGADEGVVGQVLAAGHPVLMRDHRDLLARFDIEDEQGRPGAAVPIVCRGTVSGVLCAAIKRGRSNFNAKDIEILTELAELAGAALDPARRQQHFAPPPHAHAEAPAAARDRRAQPPARHSEDVVGLARKVGELLELEADALLE